MLPENSHASQRQETEQYSLRGSNIAGGGWRGRTGASEGGLGSGEEGGRHSLHQQDSGPVNSLGGGREGERKIKVFSVCAYVSCTLQVEGARMKEVKE